MFMMAGTIAKRLILVKLSTDILGLDLLYCSQEIEPQGPL